MFCAESNILVNDLCEASARYQQAIGRLLALVGQRDAVSFGYAKYDCGICRQDCKGKADALNTHLAAHGCNIDAIRAGYGG
jgi:hypothetical protein